MLCGITVENRVYHVTVFLRNFNGRLTHELGLPTIPAALPLSGKFRRAVVRPYQFAPLSTRVISSNRARRRALPFGLMASLILSLFLALLLPVPAHSANCLLNSPQSRIRHVIYIQFNNTHFTRDNPNVPSDLERMPYLLNFIKREGTLLMIFHTATRELQTATCDPPPFHAFSIPDSSRSAVFTAHAMRGVLCAMPN
jgi:hypothetical protein